MESFRYAANAKRPGTARMSAKKRIGTTATRNTVQVETNATILVAGLWKKSFPNSCVVADVILCTIAHRNVNMRTGMTTRRSAAAKPSALPRDEVFRSWPPPSFRCAIPLDHAGVMSSCSSCGNAGRLWRMYRHRVRRDKKRAPVCVRAAMGDRKGTCADVPRWYESSHSKEAREFVVATTGI